MIIHDIIQHIFLHLSVKGGYCFVMVHGSDISVEIDFFLV